MPVGFPVDYRYGWDLDHAPHRKTLGELRALVKPKALFSSPDCRYWGSWSRFNIKKNPNYAQRRKEQIPTLQWLYDQNKAQVHDGHLFLTENPGNSLMFSKSPLKDHSKLKGYVKIMFDQCCHGLVDMYYLPIKKNTRIDCNLEMPMVKDKCQGHFDNRGHPIEHSKLEGKDPDGLSRTSKAAVYTRALCRMILFDINMVLLFLGLHVSADATAGGG